MHQSTHRRPRRPAPNRPLSARPAPQEVENQDNHGDDHQQVNERAADVAEQAEKPEDGDDDGYPKQHVNLPIVCLRMEKLVLRPSSYLPGPEARKQSSADRISSLPHLPEQP